MRRFAIALAVALFAFAAPAEARVTVTFYSHDSGMYGGDWVFPHAFILVNGTRDAGGAPVTGNWGFTASNLSIGLLWHPVDGEVTTEQTPDYVSESVRHLSVSISDAQYDALMDVVNTWKTDPEPSYDIDNHNCVTFVRELAEAIGLSADDSSKNIRDPMAFLSDLDTRNAGLANVTLPGTAKPAPMTAGMPGTN